MYPLIPRFALCLILFCSLMACGKTPVPPVNKTPDGLAIKGYDPVAYITQGTPLPGLAENEFVWKGARWRFASSEHRAMFRLNPEKYAPQYGGYCAYAVSQGKTADIDPFAWTIVGGKLYLNLDKDVQDLWEKDREAYIRKADENWPGLLKGK
jgi:YHS domain-containing protein